MIHGILSDKRHFKVLSTCSHGFAVLIVVQDICIALKTQGHRADKEYNLEI